MFNKHNKLVFYIELYTLFTIIVYFFGPLRYGYENSIQLIVYISLYHVLFVLGYMFATKHLYVVNRFHFESKATMKRNKILIIATVIYLIFGGVEIIRVFGSFNVSSITTKLIDGLSNAGNLYQSRLEENAISSGSIYTKLQTLLSPITYIVIPLGIAEYKNISRNFKYLWIITILVNLIANLMTGMSIGVFRIIMSAVFSVYILYIRNNREKQKNEKKLGMFIVIAVLLISFILIFLNNVSSRMPYIVSYISGIYIDYSHVLIKYLPIESTSGLLLFISYLTQGYHGMDLALDYKWLPTFPIGNSSFLMNNVSFLNISYEDIFERTYLSRMAHEWSPTINWHTAYTWFANDVSFIGVILLMFLLGISLSIIFEMAVKDSTLAFLLFPLIMQLIIFLPMNNAILSNSLTFMPFFIFTMLFIFTKRMVIVKKKLKNKRSC